MWHANRPSTKYQRLSRKSGKTWVALFAKLFPESGSVRDDKALPVG